MYVFAVTPSLLLRAYVLYGWPYIKEQVKSTFKNYSFLSRKSMKFAEFQVYVPYSVVPSFSTPQDQQNGKQTLSVTTTFELGKGVLIKRNK